MTLWFDKFKWKRPHWWLVSIGSTSVDPDLYRLMASLGYNGSNNNIWETCHSYSSLSIQIWWLPLIYHLCTKKLRWQDLIPELFRFRVYVYPGMPYPSICAEFLGQTLMGLLPNQTLMEMKVQPVHSVISWWEPENSLIKVVCIPLTQFL